MITQRVTEYSPTKISHAGVTLKETLRSIGMTQSELAKRMGRPIKTINEIIKGKATITSETALQLETVLGVPASFWLKRQQLYDESVARIRQSNQLQHFVTWAGRFPINEMHKYFNFPKHIDKVDKVKELLTFFGVVSPTQWESHWDRVVVSYRKSSAFTVQKEALSAWLRIGELKAQKVKCANFSETAFKAALHQIRSLTTTDPEHFEPKVKELCASSGVAYVLIPELPKTHVSGATRWISSKRALIQQNLRFKTNDQFWFTFFHEAGHILLHNNQDLILEYKGNQDEREKEADKFAADFLISPREYHSFVSKGIFTRASVGAFAKSISIDPAIVVGRLQHDKYIGYDYLNGLKEKFQWVIEQQTES